MKNLFTSKTVAIVFLVFYTQVASPAINEWTETGTISHRTLRELVDRGFYVALVAFARYKGANDVYTEKWLPGRNKEDVL